MCGKFLTVGDLIFILLGIYVTVNLFPDKSSDCIVAVIVAVIIGKHIEAIYKGFVFLIVLGVFIKTLEWLGFSQLSNLFLWLIDSCSYFNDILTNIIF